MIEAGEVGAVFRVVDEASVVLQRLARQFKELDALVLDVQKHLKGFGSFGLGKLSGEVEALDKQLLGVGSAAEQAALTASGAFGKVDDSLLLTAANVGKLSREMTALGVEAKSVGRLPGPSIRNGGGGGRGGGNSGPHGVSGPSDEEHGAFHIRPHELPAGYLGTIGGSAMGGPVAVGAVASIIATYEAFKFAGELKDVQEKLKIGGVTDAQIKQATDLAYVVGAKYGVTAESVLDTINEIRNPLGGMDEAMKAIPMLGASMTVLGSLDRRKGTSTANEIYAEVKSTEMRNLINPQDFSRAIDAITRVAVATDGRVSPAETMKQWKMLKAALPGLSDEFLFTNAPELAQEFQGSPSGTYVSSLYQQLVAGQQRVKGLKILDSLGEIDHSKLKDGDVEDGVIKSSEPGANRYEQMFKNNPRDYIMHLLGELSGAGYKTQDEQMGALSVIFGNKNAAWISAVLGFQGQRIDRGAEGIKQTEPTEIAAGELLKHAPGAVESRLAASFANAMAAAGAVLLPIGMAGMNGISNLMDRLHGPAGSVPHFSADDEVAAKRSLAKNGYRGVTTLSDGPDLAAEIKRESARGEAMMKALPPPQVKVESKIDVKVYVDGAAAVARTIIKESRAVTGANYQDSGRHFSPPD